MGVRGHPGAGVLVHVVGAVTTWGAFIAAFQAIVVQFPHLRHLPHEQSLPAVGQLRVLAFHGILDPSQDRLGDAAAGGETPQLRHHVAQSSVADLQQHLRHAGLREDASGVAGKTSRHVVSHSQQLSQVLSTTTTITSPLN